VFPRRNDVAFEGLCNQEMVLLETVDDCDELHDVRQMVENHVAYTGSPVGEYVLHHWTECVPRIIKVIPKAYKRVLESLKTREPVP
jgi:glutamate synthase (NADPH/NADH) large chain